MIKFIYTFEQLKPHNVRFNFKGNVAHPSGEWFSIAERPINQLRRTQSVRT